MEKDTYYAKQASEPMSRQSFSDLNTRLGEGLNQVRELRSRLGAVAERFVGPFPSQNAGETKPVSPTGLAETYHAALDVLGDELQQMRTFVSALENSVS